MIRTCILLFLSILFGSKLTAQVNNVTPALIKGHVIDAVNKSNLAGAIIQDLGSNNRTVADLDGKFTLYIQPGKRKVQIVYLGYADTTFVVDLVSAASTNLILPLKSFSNQLSSVLVTGYTQGQAKALNQQKNADNIKSIVSADQIGRFPDPNAAEALQRLPGINIERDQGEGRYVLVRGLAPQFTNININGEQIPSPEADVRFVALDAIPSDQLASIEVSKSLTPDMDGDAVGGSVNLITRSAQSKQLHIGGSLVGGYNQLMNKPNIQGQLQFDKRFGKKERLGIMLNTNYYHNHLGSDNWEQSPIDNEVELRDYELVRTRFGLSSTIDYKFNNRNEIYFRSLYSRFSDREWRRRYVFIPNDDEIEKLTKDRFESQSITTFNLGGKHNLKHFFVNYETQFSLGEQKTPYDHEIGFIADLPSNLSFSSIKFPTINAAGFNDNSNYEFDEASFGNTYAKDRNITAKIEFGIPYKLHASNGVLKFGGKIRSKKKSYSIVNDVFESNGGIPNADAFDEAPLKNSFLNGRYNLGRPINVSRFNQFFNENAGLFELDVEGKAIDEALEAFEATENVYAGFAMARQQFKKLLVVAGVRYEKTNVDYQSKDVLINASGDLEAIIPIRGKSNYDFILPQAQFKYELNKFTNIRGAATFSYARPNFNEIIPAQEINVEDNVANIGNATLQPTKAFNTDLMIERYFGNIGLASAGLFYKKLNDFIYRKVVFNSPYPFTGVPLVNSIDVIQAQNGNTANLFGFELAFQRNLGFLPGILKHLSIYTNYTYTYSRATIQSRIADVNKPNETEKLRLPGQANHVGNLSLGYEHKNWIIRVAANFNGEYLSEVGGNSNEDLYVKSRMQLDINASYILNKKFRFFGEFLNITNQPFETFMGNKNVLVQREFYKSWARIGVKFDFKPSKN